MEIKRITLLALLTLAGLSTTQSHADSGGFGSGFAGGMFGGMMTGAIMNSGSRRNYSSDRSYTKALERENRDLRRSQRDLEDRLDILEKNI
ncbi:hypothetical protein HOL34_00685 [bacterium]|jgi:hypothetical protein|nr:hypothetical protein [bacterium]MBT3903535.1 hypothetical protein [bacterium]MBT4578032.1 hypothetical protein [bacterium]MBT5346131.1 hypothetical protein [bacterium]MBT6131400.1 hypothetical protein [bacterium]